MSEDLGIPHDMMKLFLQILGHFTCETHPSMSQEDLRRVAILVVCLLYVPFGKQKHDWLENLHVQ